MKGAKVMTYPTMKDVLKMTDEERKAMKISLIDDTFVGEENGIYSYFLYGMIVKTNEPIDLSELYYSEIYGYIYKGQRLDDFDFVISAQKY